MLKNDNSPLTGANPIMSIGSALVVSMFVLFTLFNPDYAGSIYGSARDFISQNFDWYYIGLLNFFIVLAVLLIFSKYGNIRLGADNDRPEFSYFAWFSMLFGAGIGIGILFWSIAEPITYFQGNPFIDTVRP